MQTGRGEEVEVVFDDGGESTITAYFMQHAVESDAFEYDRPRLLELANARNGRSAVLAATIAVLLAQRVRQVQVLLVVHFEGEDELDARVKFGHERKQATQHLD